MSGTDSRKQLAESAKEMIEESYSEKFSMQILAKRLYVAEGYLYRVFKEQVGCTPLQYAQNVKCERAKELLEKKDLSIGRIAWEVGFSNTAHFSRVFHKTVGVSPSVYRKQAQSGQEHLGQR